MSSVVYRRAAPGDYPAILRLQSANFIAHLPEAERRDGFLSAEFSPGQVAAIAEELGIVVAVDSGAVAGYLCGFRRKFDHGSPVLAKMLASCDSARFEGKPLDSYHSYIYGPVCIDRNFRRRGLLRGLYEAQKRDLAGRFEIGVAFVARNNPHSLQAHVAGLGMAEAGEFVVNGNVYAILAFGLPPAAV